MEPDYNPHWLDEYDDQDCWERLDEVLERVIDDLGQQYRSLMIETGREMELPPEWRNQ